MKRRIMALIFVLALSQPAPCREKSGMIRLDITSFLRGAVEVGASYGFSPHWSVGGEVSFTYKRVIQTKSPLQVEHESEFVDTSLPADSSLQSGRIMLSYWPRELMNGFHVSLGLQSGSYTDIISEAGYMVSLWKGLCLSMGLCIPVIKSIREERFDTQNLRIGIQYKF